MYKLPHSKGKVKITHQLSTLSLREKITAFLVGFWIVVSWQVKV